MRSFSLVFGNTVLDLVVVTARGNLNLENSLRRVEIRSLTVVERFDTWAISVGGLVRSCFNQWSVTGKKTRIDFVTLLTLLYMNRKLCSCLTFGCGKLDVKVKVF